MSNSSQLCTCSICKKNYSKSYIDLHMRTHTGLRPFECPHCEKRFTQLPILRNHISCLHTKNEYKWFQCSTCAKTFSSKKTLTAHMKVHKTKITFRCNTHNKRFLRISQLTKHNKLWHSKYRAMLICAHCRRRFPNKGNLIKHIVENHEDVIDTFMCDICDKKYTRKDWLSNHIQIVHSKLKSITCFICNKKVKGLLSKHIRIHRKEGNYELQFSDDTFAQQSRVKVRHERTKKGENAYVCQICHSSFSLLTFLKTHVRDHTGEKLYVCKLCRNSFSQLADLKEHLSDIHEERYFCVTCHCTKESENELIQHRKECDTERVKSMTAPLSKMRFLFAILLTKILTPQVLEKLGFGKRLIDDILQDCISQTEQPLTNITDANDAEKFRCKLQIFLEWAIPDRYMEHLRYMTTENILKRLVQK